MQLLWICVSLTTRRTMSTTRYLISLKNTSFILTLTSTVISLLIIKRCVKQKMSGNCNNDVDQLHYWYQLYCVHFYLLRIQLCSCVSSVITDCIPFSFVHYCFAANPSSLCCLIQANTGSSSSCSGTNTF